MTYDQAIDYLFNQRPAFERQGAGGYKPGLATTIALDNYYGNPHTKYKTIHVAGTNGKGSVSHMLAAIMQSQGYKVGLYTSPHFEDFRERIKVNGEMIPEQRVIDFVDDFTHSNLDVEPSFFELTSALAFKYYEEMCVDYAIIEVGLGGRLDSTNIISPVLGIITNISLDHTEFLGNTVEQIASEKAGIIKQQMTVVVGEVSTTVRNVINNRCNEMSATPIYAEENSEITDIQHDNTSLKVTTCNHGNLSCQLTGEYQCHNVATVITAIDQLINQGVSICNDAIAHGIAHVCDITGFRGRWTVINNRPLTICDSAHNIAGISAVVEQINKVNCNEMHLVMGFMADKDLQHILGMLPKQAHYYFTQASTPRALKAESLAHIAAEHGLSGNYYDNVAEAYIAATKAAADSDFIYVGGSMYVLAEFFKYLNQQ